MISFIIPAHNEERLLPATLGALRRAANEVGQPFEIIVVNDGSTDRTGEIAAERGARVLNVGHRQIAATRNAGARAASGAILVFVDADTQVSAAVIREALDALKRGAVGGTCHFRYDGPIPRWARVVLPIGNALGRLLKVGGGACVFCRRTAFDAVAGFSERHFAAEDVVFAKALKRQGQFVIPRATVRTSNRKLRHMSFGQAMALLYRFVVRGPETYLSREGLGLWYGPEARDDGPDSTPQPQV